MAGTKKTESKIIVNTTKSYSYRHVTGELVTFDSREKLAEVLREALTYAEERVAKTMRSAKDLRAALQELEDR